MSTNSSWGWNDDEIAVDPGHLYLVESVTRYQRYLKPAIDLVGGLLLFLVTVPVILLSMLLVLATMGRPVLYRQERVGIGGRTFELYKLRTMIPDRRTGRSDDYEGPERRIAHKSPEDPRVGRLGAWLRALRLDEFPQLWNVLKGDMSLVGPRPELPDIVTGYENWQHRRHAVKPGLTGLWQVSAPQGKLMHECTELDLEYIATMSLMTDLEIALKTPSAMLRRRGF